MIIPKNWSKFQHYKKRRPPWIKLHRDLLDDHVFNCLPDASKALAPMLWLIASERLDGVIPLSIDALAFRLHMDSNALAAALKPLISAGYFEDASNVLADCKQDASNMLAPETETETEDRGQKDISSEAAKSRRSRRPQPAAADPDFEAWWKTYPRREAKGAAEKAYAAAKKIATAEELLAGATKARQRYTDPKFTPMPATWLNQKRWQDESGASGPSSTSYTTGSSYV